MTSGGQRYRIVTKKFYGGLELEEERMMKEVTLSFIKREKEEGEVGAKLLAIYKCGM